MSEMSARFALPFIIPGQAQKEFHHNEALVRIDAALAPVVEDAPAADPPPGAVEGQCWIVAEGATGAWSGNEDQIACMTAGGWRFIAPQPGMLAWVRPQALWLHWDGTAWSDGHLPASSLRIGGEQVVGPRQPGIAAPSGGSVVDAEARAAIADIIVTLMQHGLTD